MKGYSLTFAAIIAAALPQAVEALNGAAGTTLTMQCVNEVGSSLWTLAMLGVAAYARYRAGGVNLLGFRR